MPARSGLSRFTGRLLLTAIPAGTVIPAARAADPPPPPAQAATVPDFLASVRRLINDLAGIPDTVVAEIGGRGITGKPPAPGR